MYSGESGIKYTDNSSQDNYLDPIGVEPTLDGAEPPSKTGMDLLNSAHEL